MLYLNILVPISLIVFIVICVIKDLDVIITNIVLFVVVVLASFLFNGIIITLGSNQSFDYLTYTPKLFILTTLVVEFGTLIFYFIDEDRKNKLGGYWFVGPFFAIFIAFGIRSAVNIFNGRAFERIWN